MVSTDRLVDAIWGEQPPRSCEKAVQNAVLRLRKLLAPDVIQTASGGYALGTDRDAVDLWRFERLVGQGRQRARSQDWAGAEVLLSDAVTLWHGEPLAELGDWAPAVAERTRMAELHRTVSEELMEVGLARGRHHELVAELGAMADDEPLRERRWALLMVGLHRCGRKAEALRAYQLARDALTASGLEPGAELRSLERSIVADDPTLELRFGSSTGAHRWHARSFVLTDVVGSVGLWEANSDRMAQAMEQHDSLVGREVDAAGGTLVQWKGEGDSTFSVFTRPLEAVVAAAAIQCGVADEPWDLAAPLQVRIGVHTGEAEAREGDWYGPAVNRAARLRGLAAGGQILVSGVCAGLVADKLPPTLRLVYRGRRMLKGIERPEEVWELGDAGDPRLASTTGPSAIGAVGVPSPLTRFVGRVSELGRLSELVDEHRLVTLAGPAGSGKTRLAVELCREMSGRGVPIWYAELAPLREPGPVVDVIGAALGGDLGPDPLAALARRVELLDGVLVLDNCEHLLEACVDLVERLLDAGPQLRILTTSREPLGLGGEQVWPVAPLGVPDVSVRTSEQLAGSESAELLLDRARAVRPDVAVTDDDVEAVVRICQALDGMPLAIELAAERLRSLGFQDMATHVDDQLAVLGRERPKGRHHDRHRSLRSAVDWSYDLLSEQQQVVAQDLSVFAGGFRLDALGAVCQRGSDLLDSIDELVAKSLVSFDGTTARYRLLEPIRQYFAGRLEASGRAAARREAHARWAAALCSRLGRRFFADRRALSRLGEERSNIDVALRWAHEHDIALATGIVGDLGFYWFFNHQAGGRRWCATVVADGTRVASREHARALVAAGLSAQGDKAWDRSSQLLRDALAVYRTAGSASGQGASLLWLGRTLLAGADPSDADVSREATGCFEEASVLFREAGDIANAIWCENWLGTLAEWAGDLDRAEEIANSLARECVATGIRHPLGRIWCALAHIARRRGKPDTALTLLQDAAAIYRDLDDAWLLVSVLCELSAHQAVTGDADDALRNLAESVQLEKQISDVPERHPSLAVAAMIYHARGQTALAIAALGAYDSTVRTHPTSVAHAAGANYNLPWLIEDLQETRDALDPSAVSTAAASASHRTLEALVDELITQPANSC